MAPRRLTRTLAAPASRPRPSRRFLYAALGVLALLAAVAVPAIPAAADNGIVFGSVSGDGSGDLSVTIASDNPLTTVTVHLWSGTDDVLDTSDFSLQGTFEADTPQTYVLNSPAADLEQDAAAPLPPGTYTATGDATDNQGNSVSGQSISGDFGFVAQPVITLNDFNTTQADQPVTVGGVVTCSTLACPADSWAGTIVTVTDQTTATPPAQPPTGTVAADGTGDFTVDSVIGVLGDSYVASVAPVQGVSDGATSAAATDTPQFLTGSFTSISVAKPVPYGMQTVTGAVTYEQDGSFVPLGVQGVVVTATAPHETPVVSQPTAANGDFTLVLPAAAGTTPWQFSTPAGDLDSTPFLLQTETAFDETQMWPTKVTGFYARVNADMELTVGGCLATSVTPAPADDPPVDIEFKTSTMKTWKVLGAVPSKAMTGCSGVVFAGSGPAAAPRAYYRAYFPGDSAYERATSSSVLAARTQDRYHDFTVTPHSIAAGKKITVSGTLQYLSGKTWRAYTKQEVLIAYWNGKDPKDQTWWEFRWVKTSSKGAIKVTFADTEGTQYWSVDFPGNSTHYAVWAPIVLVKVHGHVSTTRVATKPPAPVARVARSASWQLLMAAQPLMALLSV